MGTIGISLQNYGEMKHLKRFDLLIRAMYGSLSNSPFDSLCQWLESAKSNALRRINITVDVGSNHLGLPFGRVRDIGHLFIEKDHFRAPLKVQDVLRNMGLDRYQLKLVFRGVEDTHRLWLDDVIPACRTAKLHRRSRFEFTVMFSSLGGDIPSVDVKEIEETDEN